MYIDKNWRVLTIGDGDLSFSLSLLKDKQIKHLTASVLDQESTVIQKYQDNAVSELRQLEIDLFFGLDVCQPDDFSAELQHKFDLIIFQFPLIPGFSSKQDFQRHKHLGSNGLNRFLLFQFLHQACNYFCDPEGGGLAYITSKDVKPYSHWNIENLYAKPHFHCLGKIPFNINEYPQYRLRNVDRDKVVKSTRSYTYVWGDIAPLELQSVLSPSTKCLPDHCDICGKGPFLTPQKWQQHKESLSHKTMHKYELNWHRAINNGLLDTYS